MYDQSFVDAINKTKASSLSQSMKPEPLALRKKLLEVTSWLPDSFPIASRMMVVRDGITEIPFCRCGAALDVDKSGKRPFQKFCSDKCNRVFSRLSEHASTCLHDIEWVRKHRYELKMSLDAIAELLGTSHVAVKNAIERFELPLIRYNETTPEVADLLADGEYIKASYDGGNTLRKIAKDANTSVCVVVKYMKKNNIKPKPANSYDRKPTHRSNEEKSLDRFVRSEYGGCVMIGKKKISGKSYDVDVFCPELKLAIEYNGLYYHRYVEESDVDAIKKDADYHIGKSEYAANLGIRLMHVYSDLWNKNTEIAKSIIRHALGATKIKIHARKCKIKSVEYDAATLFLRKNNAFGACDFDFSYGLYFNDELVSIVSMKNTHNGVSVVRSCHVIHTIVVGGVSKLLNYIRKINEGNITANVDYSLFSGKSLKLYGFTHIGTNPPTQWNTDYIHRWVDVSNRVSRGSIFDCGELVFLWDEKGGRSPLDIYKQLLIRAPFRAS